MFDRIWIAPFLKTKIKLWFSLDHSTHYYMLLPQIVFDNWTFSIPCRRSAYTLLLSITCLIFCLLIFLWFFQNIPLLRSSSGSRRYSYSFINIYRSCLFCSNKLNIYVLIYFLIFLMILNIFTNISRSSCLICSNKFISLSLSSIYFVHRVLPTCLLCSTDFFLLDRIFSIPITFITYLGLRFAGYWITGELQITSKNYLFLINVTIKYEPVTAL